MHEADVGLDDKVSFLRRADAYPGAPQAVHAVETHMSWVFLTEASAYKLKKPVRFDGLNFSSSQLRRDNCEEEVRLNRRLARDVYLGVLPLTVDSGGMLAIDGSGRPVDWLVHMRRLPADRMLDAIIAGGRVAEEMGPVGAAAEHLARFYGRAQPEPMRPAAYRARLSAGVQQDLDELSRPRFGLPLSQLQTTAERQFSILASSGEHFDQRVEDGRLVEGHGDLRPEHICVRQEPAIIDCLEFDRTLRVLDPADELAFLALECERLGAPLVGKRFFDAYIRATGDEPPQLVLDFYRTYRALRRATIAARHLDDPQVRQPAQFAARARHYLALAAHASAAGEERRD